MVQPRQTFGGIDIVRFLAAVMVMLFHYGFWAWVFPEGMSGRAAGALPPQPGIGGYVSFGWVGVPIFFVISGFIIAFSAEHSTPGKFFEARFKRLAPAVWVCAPITAAILLLCGITWPTQALTTTVRTALFIPFGPWVDSVYWTLGIEIAFYAVVWLLLTIRRLDWIEAIALVVGAASTAFWAMFFAFGWTSLAEDRLLDLLLVHHGCFFGLGVLIWLMRFKALTFRRVTAAALFAVGGVLQIVSAVQVLDLKTGVANPVVLPIVVFLVSVGFIVWSLRLNLAWSGWRKIGLMTYPLYLLHNVVGAALLGLLVVGGVNYLLAMAIVSALIIAASWLIATEVEPRIRLLFNHVLFRHRLAQA